jgi:hypothetical protein
MHLHADVCVFAESRRQTVPWRKRSEAMRRNQIFTKKESADWYQFQYQLKLPFPTSNPDEEGLTDPVRPSNHEVEKPVKKEDKQTPAAKKQ